MCQKSKGCQKGELDVAVGPSEDGEISSTAL